MHELPITKNVFEIVLKHAQKNDVEKVKSVHLEIGVLSDLKSEWVQRYFDHLSKGTVVEGALLNIVPVSAVFRCNKCQQSFEIQSVLEEDVSCKKCKSKDLEMISGKEYRVKNMEVI